MPERPARVGASVRTFVTVVMDILVIVAVILVVHMVIVFFGQLAGQPWAKTIVDVTGKITLPLGMAGIRTPYGGVFDVNAAATVLVLLGIEWVLGSVRRTV